MTPQDWQQLCTDHDMGRDDLSRPWIHDGRIWASDGRSLYVAAAKSHRGLPSREDLPEPPTRTDCELGDATELGVTPRRDEGFRCVF